MKFDFKKKVLKNGMTLLFEKRNIPVVSVAIAVKHGGLHESGDEKGISHFIEHMLYKGTSKRDARKIAQDIELNGGELNGFTDEGLTAYWCKMPSKHLDIALDVLSDMVKNPLFDEKELIKERNVIFEEMKMRGDMPRMYLLDKINEILYDGSFSIPLIGTKKSMNSISRDVILKKFKDVYTPNNMILCVVGEANFDDIVRFAEKNFDGPKKDFKPEKIKLKNKVVIEKRKGIDQANLILSFHSPLSGDKKCYANDVLMNIVAGGMSSRLFHEIREKRNLAYAVKGDSSVSKYFSFSLVYVGTTPDKVEEVKKLILEEFEKVGRDLDKEEFEKTKEKIIGNYIISMEDSQSQMVSLISEEIDGDAREFYNYENEIKNVKIEDVKELARKVGKNYSFIALVPE